MFRSIIIAAACMLAAFRAAEAQPRDPRAITLDARRVVEGDSTERVRVRLERVVRRSPNDREAHLALATMARLTYAHERADAHYAAVLEHSPDVPDALAAYAHLGRAFVVNQQGRALEARPLYDSARAAGEAAGRPDVVAAVLNHVSSQRSPAARSAALDSAQAMLGPDDLPLLVDVYCTRAATDRVRDFAARAAAADSGIALARRLGLIGQLGACLQNKAVVFVERGEVDEPIRLLIAADSALALARQEAGRAVALYRLGYRYLRAAQYGRALAAFRTGAEIADRIRSERNSVLNRWGAIQTALVVNDVATAQARLNEAWEILHRTQDSSSIGFARTFEALIAQASGDDARARTLFEEMLPGFVARETPANQHSLLLDLSRSTANLRDWPAALDYLARARTVARENGLDPSLGDLAAEEGRIALLRGDLAAAERLLTGALARVDTSRHAHRYGLRVRIAEVHAAMGDLARAERDLRAAGAELDAWRTTLEDQELRLLATEVRQHGGVESGVPRVIAALARGGRAEAAFELAEQRRARELLTRMSEADALRENDATAASLRERSARLVAATRADEVVAALPDDRTGLLEYVTGPGDTPTTLFVVTRAGIQALRLAPVDSLAPSILRLVSLLEEGEAPLALARALGAALLDPAIATIGTSVDRLLVVADGQLHRVPFDALRLPDGRWAVERFAVAMTPSAAVAGELWRRQTPARSAAPRVLAFGDPVFPGERRAVAGAEALALRAAFDSAGGLTRLAGSGREARLVARYAAEGEARVRGAASEAFVKRAALERYDVVHFATHALVDERTMARTALALAPGDGEDGFLSPADLATLPLSAELVVLSACRTASGKLLGGEGVWGLTAPLLQAGARSVVATGWRVSDERTVRLVADFYDALAEGNTVADALRGAKLAAIARGAPPGEWAAFTVVGDPLATVALQRPTDATGRRRTMPLALLAIGFMGAAGWLRLRRR